MPTLPHDCRGAGSARITFNHQYIMPKKICPNGHIYDSSIYGEECPLCPKDGAGAQYEFQSNPGQESVMSPGTRVSPPAGARMEGLSNPFSQSQQAGGYDAAGETQFKPQQGGPAAPVGGGTMIRPPKGSAKANGRKLVGFLVTYNRNPLGKSYELYEGKNYIGRDRSADIVVSDDNQISGRHMSILYRNVDNKFKFRDEQSSNGTFVNKELTDEGELQNFDIIRLGSTVFIFIAIPQI